MQAKGRILHLLRHAKSCRQDATLADHERPLNGRGIAACAIMSRLFYQHKITPSQVAISSAVRAQQTFQNIRTGWPNLQYHTDQNLYCFSVNSLYDWLRRQHEQTDNLLIIGHNPALFELIDYLTLHPIKKLPTCGYAQLTISPTNWSELSLGKGKLRMLITPKNGVIHQ